MRNTRTSLLLLATCVAFGCPADSNGSGGDTATGTGDNNGSTGQGTSTSGVDQTTSVADGSSDGTSEGSSGGTPTDCTDRPTARPSPRSELDGVWDTARGAMISFGGDQGIPAMCMPQSDFVAETWAFFPDCDNFELLDTGGGPSPRGRHAVALDRDGNRMIIHGGRWRPDTVGAYTLYDDTWIFDLATDTWEQVASTGPSARTNHTAIVANGQYIVYGGNASTNGLAFIPLDDLWSLDLATGTWTELQSVGGPSARLFHAAAVSDDQSTMFVYGGGDVNAFVGPFFRELFALDLASGQWTELHDGVSNAPIGSIWGDLLLDSAANRLILWGAHEDNDLGNANKIWQFDLGQNTWTMLEEGDVLDNSSATFCNFPADFVDFAEGTPERRSGGVAVLTDQSEMLVFGGKTDCGIIDDVWSWPLAGGAWDNRQRATFGEICLRAFAEGCDSMCM